MNNVRSKSSSRVLALGRSAVLLGGIVVIQPSLAATQAKVYIGAGADYHDNMTRTSINEESDVDMMTRARVTLDRTDEPLTIAMGYLVEHHDFLDDIEDDKTLWTGSTLANWELLANRLDLSLLHNVSEQPSDRREADTIANNERVSTLSVAMMGYLRPTSADTIQITPRFTDVQLDDSGDSDSQHTAGEIAWLRALSSVSTLQLSGIYDQAQFDEDTNDYDYSSALLTYSTRLARLTYSIGAGFNWIEVDVGEDSDGYRMNVAVDYLGDSYSWGASAIRRLTDSAFGLTGERVNTGRDGADRVSGLSDGNVDQFDIVETTEIELRGSWMLDSGSNLLARVGYAEQDYQTIARDENNWRLDVGYSFDVNRQWSLGVNAAYDWSKFLDTPSYKQSDSEVELYAAWQFTERLSTRFSIVREQRDSDLAGAEYTDNIASVSIEYQVY